MSIAELPEAPAVTAVTWATVEDGFHVASSRGDFLGSVCARGDGFVAFDGRSEPLGRFDTSDQACAAVEAGRRRVIVARRGARV